jgi:glucan phosphoethanolaminetransferase (alkaline phosphatase superfamily)
VRPQSRTAKLAIILAKVAASLLLMAATLGFLWHPTPGIALGNPGGPDVPVWLATAALGWYQDFLNNLVPFFRRSFMLAVAYGWASAFCVLAVFLVPFIANTPLRIALSVLLIGGISYDLIMYEVGGMPPKLQTTYTILMNARFGVEEGTAGLYSGTIARNLAFTSAALAIYSIRPPPLPKTVRWLPLFAIAMAAASIGGILWRTGGYTRAFPSPFSSYIDAYLALQQDRDQPIADVRYPAQPVGPFEKIVLVMDESIRGDYLSLNDPAVETTPFLLSRSKDIANFGIAVSASNCSAESRMVTRYGLRDDDVETPWKELKSRTTLWQYAHKAGFKTVYIDTVGTPVLPYYGMTATELKFVDDRIIVTGTPLYSRDERVADRLAELLRTPGRLFIYVEKYGAHVPYDKMYPPSENVFGADLQAPFRLENRGDLIRHYKDAIRWSVDRFFSVVLAKGLPPDALILYTSDHGQSLSESASRQTHCSTSATAAKAEGSVPLFAMTSDPTWDGMLRQAAAANFNRADQYDIFPTLLMAMGYGKSWIAENYAGSLLDNIPVGRRRRFMAGGKEQTKSFDK